MTSKLTWSCPRRLWLVLLLLVTACGAAGSETEESRAEATARDENTLTPKQHVEALETRDTATRDAANEAIATGRGYVPLSEAAQKYAEYDIITLLPKDGIPAIDNPEFLTAAEADAEYNPREFVMGVEFNGEARAYSVPLLSRHEIVNDIVGGVKIAVTW